MTSSIKLTRLVPLVLLLTLPTVSQAGAAQNPEPIQPATPQKPQLICRGGEKIVGTHMRTGRRCMTAAEWQQEAAKLQGPVPTLRVTANQDDGQPTHPSPQ
jgi:hypothetical protein